MTTNETDLLLMLETTTVKRSLTVTSNCLRVFFCKQTASMYHVSNLDPIQDIARPSNSGLLLLELICPSQPHNRLEHGLQ